MFFSFVEQFESFQKSAEDEISLLQTSMDIMIQRYSQVAELFTFDIAKYSQEEFFRDFNEFISLWKVSDFYPRFSCIIIF